MRKDQNTQMTPKQESTMVSKKAYEKPQVVYSAPLEAVAGYCNTVLDPIHGKASGATGCSVTSS